MNDDELKIAAEKATAMGFDWNRILEIISKFPEAAVLIRRIIDLFTDPNPPGPFGAGHDNGCDHKECCEQALMAAICSAHCAAVCFKQCCDDE